MMDSIDRAQKSIDAAIAGLADIRDAVDGARGCTGPKLAERQRCISILVEMAREENRRHLSAVHIAEGYRRDAKPGVHVAINANHLSRRNALMQAARRIKG